MIFGSFARNLSVFGAGFALLATATPVLPQDGNDGPPRRLEAEVRALRARSSGDGRFFEPEMTAQPRSTTTSARRRQSPISSRGSMRSKRNCSARPR